MTTSLHNTDQKPHLHWPELDGLRFLAFFMVFFSHIGPFPEVERFPNLAWLLKGYNQCVLWGWMGVDLFFVLSAFLITSLLLSEREYYGNFSIRQFLLRRVLRIWPLYYLALFLGFVILPLLHWQGIVWGSPAWQSMLSDYFWPFMLFLGNIPFAIHLTPITPMISPLWSVCIEEQFYISWSLGLKRLKRPKHIILTLSGLLLLTVAIRAFLQQHSTTHLSYYYSSLGHLDPIIFGIAAALLWQHHRDQLKSVGKWLGAGALLGLLLLLTSFPDIFQNHPSIIGGMTLIALIWSAFLLATLTWTPFQNFFQYHPLCALGRLTYGMYVFHQLGFLCGQSLGEFLFHTTVPHKLWFSKWFLGFPLTLFFAICSWHLIERHCLQLRQQFTRIISTKTDEPSRPQPPQMA